MEKIICQVCGREMDYNDRKEWVDHFCDKSDDHHFSIRIRDDFTSKLRIRFQIGDERLCLKVHYDEGYSEVWTVADQNNRIKIEQVIFPDFTDIDKLKNKIRTVLLFS